MTDPDDMVIGGLILDTVSVLHLAENRSPYAAALVEAAIADLRVVVVPATVLLESWAQAEERHQAFLVMFTCLPVVVVEALDEAGAIDAGAAAAAAAMPKTGPGILQAVHLASTRGWPLLTGEPQTVWAIDPHIQVESLS